MMDDTPHYIIISHLNRILIIGVEILSLAHAVSLVSLLNCYWLLCLHPLRVVAMQQIMLPELAVHDELGQVVRHRANPCSLIAR